MKPKTYMKKVQLPKTHKAVRIQIRKKTVLVTLKENKMFGKKKNKIIKVPKGTEVLSAAYNKFLNKVRIRYVKGSVKKFFNIK